RWGFFKDGFFKVDNTKVMGSPGHEMLWTLVDEIPPQMGEADQQRVAVKPMRTLGYGLIHFLNPLGWQSGQEAPFAVRVPWAGQFFGLLRDFRQNTGFCTSAGTPRADASCWTAESCNDYRCTPSYIRAGDHGRRAAFPRRRWR